MRPAARKALGMRSLRLKRSRGDQNGESPENKSGTGGMRGSCRGRRGARAVSGIALERA